MLKKDKTIAVGNMLYCKADDIVANIEKREVKQNITLNKTEMQTNFNELVVLTREEVYYATVSIIDFSELTEAINAETISYRKIYEIHHDSQDFEVYLVLYKSFEKYMYTLNKH